MSGWSVVGASVAVLSVFVAASDPAALQAAAMPLLALVAGIVLAWAFYDWEEIP